MFFYPLTELWLVQEQSQEIDLYKWDLTIGLAMLLGLSAVLSSLPMGNGMLAIHRVQCTLNKLSSVIDCDEEPTETSA